MKQSSDSITPRPYQFGGLSRPGDGASTLFYSPPVPIDAFGTIDPGSDMDPEAAAALRGEFPRGRLFEAGQWVGRYLLIEPLGAGSQAVVWRATDDATPPRQVALKLLATHASWDHRGVARLRREAGRGQRLRSSAILKVSDFGIVDGVAYMAMPLVEGGTLADVLEWRHHRPATGPSPGDANWLSSLPRDEYVPAVAEVMARVARALQVAHEAAVVHCDIKPANVLLDRNRLECVFLSDFGMGRDLDAMRPGQRWDLSGTPRYMAPELLLGQPADGRLCDVYSLGVTIFEAVTEAHPIRSAEAGMPLAARLASLAAREPKRVRAVAPWVPADLAAIVERAMAIDPARRHPRASALAEDLDRFLDGLSAVERTTPPRVSGYPASAAPLRLQSPKRPCSNSPEGRGKPRLEDAVRPGPTSRLTPIRAPATANGPTGSLLLRRPPPARSFPPGS